MADLAHPALGGLLVARSRCNVNKSLVADFGHGFACCERGLGNVPGIKSLAAFLDLSVLPGLGMAARLIIG